MDLYLPQHPHWTPDEFRCVHNPNWCLFDFSIRTIFDRVSQMCPVRCACTRFYRRRERNTMFSQMTRTPAKGTCAASGPFVNQGTAERYASVPSAPNTTSPRAAPTATRTATRVNWDAEVASWSKRSTCLMPELAVSRLPVPQKTRFRSRREPFGKIEHASQPSKNIREFTRRTVCLLLRNRKFPEIRWTMRHDRVVMSQKSYFLFYIYKRGGCSKVLISFCVLQ